MPDPTPRENFRVVYPPDACPSLVWRGDDARVLHCEERELQMEAQCYADVPKIDERLGGRLVFRDGNALMVQGIVRQIRGRLVALRLDAPGVPWWVLQREQSSVAASPASAPARR